MKTAISIPNSLFEEAEALAERLGMSRSQLYATAVSRYLESYKDEAVTEKLNDIYGEMGVPVEPILEIMQFLTLTEEEWS